MSETVRIEGAGVPPTGGPSSDGPVPDPSRASASQHVASRSRRDSSALVGLASPGRVHAALLTVGYVALLGLMRGTWFRGDDFEFLANRVGDDRSLSIWYPHNEHWVSGAIAVWRVLYDIVGMSSVLPYLAVSLAAHVLVVHVLWRLMLRAGVAPWTAVGLSAVMLVLGLGWENITWAFQLTFMGSFALGLVAVLLSLRDDRVAAVGAVLSAVVALTFSGAAVPLAVAATLCLVLRRRVRRAVVLALATGLVYGVWFVTWGHLAPPTAHTQTGVSRWSGAASWAWQLLSNALGGLTSLVGFGGVLVVLLAAALVVGLRSVLAQQGGWWPAAGWDTPAVVLTTCTSCVLMQTVSLAATRNDVSEPTASRYLYFIVALLLPAIGALLTRAQAWTGPFVPLVVCLYLLATQGLLLVAQERPLESATLRADTLGLAALVSSGEPMTNAVLAVDLDVESVTKWIDEGALDPADATDQAVLDARALSQAVLSDTGEGAAPGSVVVTGLPLGTTAGMCLLAEPVPGAQAAVVTLRPGEAVGIANQGAGNLTYQLVQDDGGASRLVAAAAAPNQTLWVSVEAPSTLRVVSDNGQDIRFCNP